jgi:hypothetical protein
MENYYFNILKYNLHPLLTPNSKIKEKNIIQIVETNLLHLLAHCHNKNILRIDLEAHKVTDKNLLTINQLSNILRHPMILFYLKKVLI